MNFSLYKRRSFVIQEYSYLKLIYKMLNKNSKIKAIKKKKNKQIVESRSDWVENWIGI